MHSVKRVEEEPESLKNNKVEWTKELLNQIAINKGKISKVDEKYKNLYKQDDVKKALTEMYGGLCCYCEGNATLTGYKEIEHYKPKSKYPEFCFEWSNLHQICSKCNKNKNDKWSSDFPILSPTEDKIEEHLYFKNILLMCKEDDERAKNTINHLKLNEREEILNVRTDLLKWALEFRKRTDQDKSCFKELIFMQKDYPTYKKYLISIVDGQKI